jgi:hypothetical protein
MIPTPTPAEIDAALDVLDWMDWETVVRLRAEVTNLIRKVGSPARGDGGGRAGTPITWEPIEVALLWILFRTSDEYLEQHVRRESIH